MKVITSELMEVKILRIVCSIICLPITFPLWLLAIIGEQSEKGLDNMARGYFCFAHWVIRIFNLDEKAKRLYEEGKIKII